MAHEGFVIPPATEAFVEISRVEVSNIPLTVDHTFADADEACRSSEISVNLIIIIVFL
jgi:hypothetical protein